MKRTVKLPSVDATQFGYKSGKCPVEVEIRLEGAEINQRTGRTDTSHARVAITGEVWRPNRTDIVSGGQMAETLLELYPGNASVARLVELWGRWHLNDMRAGTHRQERYLEPIKDQFPGYPTSYYVWACEELERAGLQPDEEHRVPAPTEEDPSATKGYSYGSAWLSEEIPPEVLRELADWTYRPERVTA